MINWQELTIDTFVEQLRKIYQRTYGDVNNDLRKNNASFIGIALIHIFMTPSSICV